MSDSTDGVDLRKTTNHYADGSDSPAWIDSMTRPNATTAWATSWTRNIEAPDGDLGLIQSSDGSSKIQITNLHGDVVSTMDNSTSVTALANYTESTEYGAARAGSTSLGQNYGWLGGKRRSTDSLGGLTLMGARLYNPTTGRFLSMDPVAGGNDNTYTYPADPINMVDLDGHWGSWRKQNWKGWGRKAWRWTKRNKWAIAGAAPSFACGASVACAIGAGAAFGLAKYTSKHRSKKSWRWRGAAKATGWGAAKGLGSKYLKNKIGRYGKKHVGKLRYGWRSRGAKVHRGPRSWRPWRW